MFRRLIDGSLSFVCAILTLAIGGAPVWFSHLALQAGLVPVWGYAFVLGLALATMLLTFDFLKKAFRGVSPTRMRPR